MEYNPVNELSNKEQLSKSYCLLVLITTLFYLVQIRKWFYKQKDQIRKFAAGTINVSEHVSVSSTGCSDLGKTKRKNEEMKEMRKEATAKILEKYIAQSLTAIFAKRVKVGLSSIIQSNFQKKLCIVYSFQFDSTPRST